MVNENALLAKGIPDCPILSYNGAKISRISNYVTTKLFLEDLVIRWNSSLNAFKVLNTLNRYGIMTRFVVKL